MCIKDASERSFSAAFTILKESRTWEIFLLAIIFYFISSEAMLSIRFFKHLLSHLLLKNVGQSIQELT